MSNCLKLNEYLILYKNISVKFADDYAAKLYLKGELTDTVQTFLF